MTVCQLPTTRKKIEMNKQCFCRCHVSQSHHCEYCEYEAGRHGLLGDKLTDQPTFIEVLKAIEEKVDKNWEVTYKRDESFGKRLIEVERYKSLVDSLNKNRDEMRKEFGDWMLDKQEKIKYLEEQLDKVYRCFGKIINSGKTCKIDSVPVPKKPHVCPLCYGECGYKLQSLEDVMANDGNTFKKCQSCDGKGIVWG